MGRTNGGSQTEMESIFQTEGKAFRAEKCELNVECRKNKCSLLAEKKTAGVGCRR